MKSDGEHGGQPRDCCSATSTSTPCPTTSSRSSWPSGWPPATRTPATRWWPPTCGWWSTGPAATRTAAWTWPTWSKRARSASAGGREVRLGAGLPLLHLRHLVDPPGSPAGRPAARAHHPHPARGGEQPPAPRAVTAELAGQLGRPPTEEELDEATGMTAAERTSLEDVARVAASLDQPAAADSATALGDLVAPDDEDWVGDVEQAMVSDRVREAVERLPGSPARRAPAALRLRRRLPGLAAVHGRAPRRGRPAGAPGRGGGPGRPVGRRRRASAPTRPPEPASPLGRPGAQLTSGSRPGRPEVLGSGDSKATGSPCPGVRTPSGRRGGRGDPGPRRASGRPVAGVAHHRVADGRQVDPDLVGAPGVQGDARAVWPARRSWRRSSTRYAVRAGCPPARTAIRVGVRTERPIGASTRPWSSAR